MNFLCNQAEAERAQKRGGTSRIVSIDVGDEEVPIPASGLSPEEALDRVWARNIFDQATEKLRACYTAANKEIVFRIFEQHELQARPPSCKELAGRFGVSVTQVENHLKHARALFQRVLRSLVRETLSDDSDLDDELHFLGEALRR
jgi:hypothetical protein